MLTATEVTEYFESTIKPILTKYDVTEFALDNEAHLKAKDFQVFYPLKINVKGDEIELSGRHFEPKCIEWMLKRWDKLQTILSSLMGFSSPFHSDVYGYFKSEWKTLDQRQGSNLAYEYICGKLRKAGKNPVGD